MIKTQISDAFILCYRKHRHKSRILNPISTTEFVRSVSVPADRMISKSSVPSHPSATPVTPDLEYVRLNLEYVLQHSLGLL